MESDDPRWSDELNRAAAMRRGDIWMVDFSVPTESEAAHRRPAIIVSNDAANMTAARLGRGVVTVVPVTGNVDRIYPFQVSLPARLCQLAVDSKAQAEQVRAVAVERIDAQVGRLPADLMNKVDHALHLHLAL